MGWYEDQVLPRVVDLVLGNARMGQLRERALAEVTGVVLELGFGSGTNLDHYPRTVEQVLAVDPAMVGRRLARKRLARNPVPVEFVGLDGQQLPLADDSVDNAVTTWTMCTIPDAVAALREVRRVVRPGGRLFFLEHGLSDDPAVARRQRRGDRLQQRIAGGCHLDRRHDELIVAAGLELERCDQFRIAGPATMSHMYAGTALVPA